MTTRSRDPTYSSPAVKRQRSTSVGVTTYPSCLSRLESLPTEILQLIFFASLNGNLLRAAPRIASKLSGSRGVYRTAFLIAFYHPHILDLRSAFKFDHLLSDMVIPIPSWEVRSMQKIVLDSQWCTFGWFKSLASELLDYAYAVYRNTHAIDLPSESYSSLDRLLRKREDLLALCGAAGGALDDNERYLELVIDPFDMRINYWSDEIERDDDSLDQADGRAGRWQLQLRGIGSAPVRSEFLRGQYDDSDHFRRFIKETIILVPEIKSPRSTRTDMWEFLERSMLDAISNDQVKVLRDLLEINYFFWPEDAPFTLSPRLFVAAARQDYPDSLYLLFQVDPAALPRSESNLRWLAADLEEQRTITKEHRYGMRKKRRDNKAGGGVYSEDARRIAVQLDYYMQYTEDMDEAISHYVRTGCLMRKANPLSPDFSLRTEYTPLESHCDNRLFGCEDEYCLQDKSGHTCVLANHSAGEGSDQVDWPPSIGSDSDDWPNDDGLDMIHDESTSVEDEESAVPRIPSGLDWVCLRFKRNDDDNSIKWDRKEDYHYMMA